MISFWRPVALVMFCPFSESACWESFAVGFQLFSESSNTDIMVLGLLATMIKDAELEEAACDEDFLLVRAVTTGMDVLRGRCT